MTTASYCVLAAPRRWLLAFAVVLSAWCGLAAPALAQATDTLVTKRDTQLRSAPADTAPVLAAVPANTVVNRLPERQGAWVKASVDNRTGWLHMFDIGSPASAAASSGGSNVFRGLGNLFGRPSSTTVATTTVGIRGLDANDIANAQPNTAAVTQGEAMRVSAADAQQFAARAALRTHTLDDLPVPQRRPGDAQ